MKRQIEKKERERDREMSMCRTGDQSINKLIN